MKTMRICKWIVVRILSILIFPWWVFMVSHLFNRGVAGPWPTGTTKVQEQALGHVANVITDGSTN